MSPSRPSKPEHPPIVLGTLKAEGWVLAHREDLPDPEKLELIADWFDADDAARGVQRGQEVQTDLRRWAAALRSILEAP